VGSDTEFLKAINDLKTALGPEKAKKAARFITSIKKVYNSPDKEYSLSTSGSGYPLPKCNDVFDYYLFSDGGCRGNPGPGAWGVVLQDKEGNLVHEGRHFLSHTTNNRMELTGAIRALEKALELGGRKVLLVSDSKYVLDGLKTWLDGWKRRGWKKADKKEPENLDLWKEVDAVRSKFEKIETQWVKGHAGHPQNERCDELVNLALDQDVQLT